MDPNEVARHMDGLLQDASPGRTEALLPSPMIQNHAAFLHLLADGALACAWFGGTLEGKSDISIFASVLPKDASAWGPPQRLSFDPAHSEQNPVFFTAPDGRLWLFHTSQPSGNQDECRIRMAEIRRGADPFALKAEEGRYLDLPRGCFVRAPLVVTVTDHGNVTWRRWNLSGSPPPRLRLEIDCQQYAYETCQPAWGDGRDEPHSAGGAPIERVRCWPIHEPGWRREITFTELVDADAEWL